AEKERADMSQATIVWILVIMLAMDFTEGFHTVYGELAELPSSPLTLDQAIQFGIDHYPSVRASLARVSAAKSGIDLTRTAYLPRVDIGYQANNATFNNLSGVFFANPFTLPITGPDLARKSYSGAWG